MASSECPPLEDRITKSLLGYGVIAGPLYVVVAAAQALTRDGFDPTRHAVSQLANGALGWIQIANFVIVGAMTVAAAVGVGRALRPHRAGRWAALLLGGYGVALLIAGALRADPSDGFPPGTPPGPPGAISWHGVAHLVAAGLGFTCFVVAGFLVGAVFARDDRAGWAWASRAMAVFFAASFLVLASGRGGAGAVLCFTAAVVLGWAWLIAVSVALYARVGAVR